MSPGHSELAQPGPWHLLQHGPHHLVPRPAHVEDDSLVELAGLLDDEGVRGLDLGQEGRGRVEGLPPQLLVPVAEQGEVLLQLSVEAGGDAAVVPRPHVDLTLPGLLGVQLTGEQRDVINITMLSVYSLLTDSCETDTCGQSVLSLYK